MEPDETVFVADLLVTSKNGDEWHVSHWGVGSQEELARYVDRNTRTSPWLTLGDVLFNRFQVVAIDLIEVNEGSKEEM